VGIPLTEPSYYIQFRDVVVDSIKAAMQDMPGINYEIVVNVPTSDKDVRGVVEASNLLVDKCLREGWDYLWIVEGDIQVPRHAFRRLYCPRADINLGVYPNHRDDVLKMMAGYFRDRPPGNPPEIVNVYDKAKLEGKVFTGMVCAGVGCCLIHRRVFESGLRFVYDVHRFRVKVGGHDQLFLYEAQKVGFKVFLHGDVICGHLPEWGLEMFA